MSTICPCPKCTTEDPGCLGCLAYLFQFCVLAAATVFLLLMFLFGPNAAFEMVRGKQNVKSIEDRIDALERSR